MDQATSSQSSETVPQRLCNNPINDGRSAFAWLVHPVPIDDFFRANWVRAPLQIMGSHREYSENPVSSLMIDNKLMDFNILYSRDIDAVKFEDGRPKINEPVGRALPNNVWSLYAQGFTLNFKSFHNYVPNLRILAASLQEFVGGPVTADLHLSPPDSQGYGPYYNDAETFILQMEGKKRWRLYEPKENRPRFPSKFVHPSEIGEPILDTVVNAGDVLYFPKGTIHQSDTIENTYSLHINLEVYQKNAGYYYFSSAGQTAADENLLPPDKVAERIMRDIVPPYLSPLERKCCVLANGARMIRPGAVAGFITITLDTRIRLLRSQSIRITRTEDRFEVYFSIVTSENCGTSEFDSFEIEDALFPAIDYIIHRYPDFVRVGELPILGEWYKIFIATDLWEKCLVATEYPLSVEN